MSTSPYSKDLREKVIKYINSCNSQKSASELFSLHRNTVSRWWNRYKKEGIYTARRRLGRKSKLSFVEIVEYVTNNPDTKLSIIGKKFGISAWHASTVLKKLGFSYKKKTLPTWNQIKIKEMNIKT
jgi:transposase